MMKKIFFMLVLLWGSSNAFSQKMIQPQPALEQLILYPNIRDFAMNPEQDEIYITLQSPQEDVSAIALLKKDKEGWSTPELLSFTGKYRDIEPFLSHDGLRLYFASNRPLDNTKDQVKDYDIWYVARKDKKSPWGMPVNMGAPVNSSSNEFYPSFSKNGNLYFTSDADDAKNKDEIYFSPLQGGVYQKPVALGEAINSDGYEFNAFIAPDESFLLFTGYDREEGLGSGDLYISFKDGKGNWSQARNLGNEVNSKWMDYCPFYDGKNKILYFTSRRSKIGLKEYRNIKEFEKDLKQYENGFSRLYKVSWDAESMK